MIRHVLKFGAIALSSVYHIALSQWTVKRAVLQIFKLILLYHQFRFPVMSFSWLAQSQTTVTYFHSSTRTAITERLCSSARIKSCFSFARFNSLNSTAFCETASAYSLKLSRTALKSTSAVSAFDALRFRRRLLWQLLRIAHSELVGRTNDPATQLRWAY